MDANEGAAAAAGDDLVGYVLEPDLLGYLQHGGPNAFLGWRLGR